MKKKIWKFFGYGDGSQYGIGYSSKYDNTYSYFIEQPINEIAYVAQIIGIVILALDIAQIRETSLTTIFMLILARPIWNFISTCIRIAVRKSWNKERKTVYDVNSMYPSSIVAENLFGDENEE